jgi:hypothetical protein
VNVRRQERSWRTGPGAGIRQRGHEVRHFVEQNGISVEQAQQLIKQHGNSREKLEEAVKQLKG